MTSTKDNQVLRIITIALAVVGGIALVGAGAMALMHGSMMGGVGMGQMGSMMAGMRC